MESVNMILFLCIAAPVLPVLTMLPDKRSRQFMIFLVIGAFLCLSASSINAGLLSLFHNDMLYVTANITPITEEILKRLPVLCFAWFMSDDRDTLLRAGAAVGLGFAMFENLVIMTANLSSITVLWAFSRGIGASLMHSTCTFLVGMGICMIRKRNKLFVCGTFSLLIAASLYHAIFNMLVQSDYRILALVLPGMISLPLAYITWKENKNLTEVR